MSQYNSYSMLMCQFFFCFYFFCVFVNVFTMIRISFKNPIRGLKLPKFGLNLIQTASITSRSTRGEPLKLDKPFPYQEKSFEYYHSYFDSTIVRVSQENAKVIIVEGPIGVGKSACAKLLAEEFDMLYLPQPTMDALYVLPSGYDVRQHDHELPEEVQSYDHKNFCLKPNDRRAGSFQLKNLFLRFYQYVDALCHLLNTGQGVVIERSYFSDYVFMKAMYENKFVSKDVFKAYFKVLENTNTFFMAPHLIIYLDIPVPVVQERIRTRNYSWEQNSPALTPQYLQSLEKFWKEDYLKKARDNSEILIYDWTDGGNIELMIEDIENIDFDILREDKKFGDWLMSRTTLFDKRQLFTNTAYLFMPYFHFDYWNYPDLDTEDRFLEKVDKVYMKIPECAYDYGYNPKCKDSIFKILFKSNVEKHRDLRLHLIFQDLESPLA